MHEHEIERVRVYAVGPETERYTWATDHAEQFVTNTIARITTRGGMEGVAGAMSVNEFCFSSGRRRDDAADGPAPDRRLGA